MVAPVIPGDFGSVQGTTGPEGRRGCAPLAVRRRALLMAVRCCVSPALRAQCCAKRLRFDAHRQSSGPVVSAFPGGPLSLGGCGAGASALRFRWVSVSGDCQERLQLPPRGRAPMGMAGHGRGISG